MPLPRPASPKALLADIRALARDRSPHRITAAVVAILMPILIVGAFIIDARTNTQPGPQLIYVKSWPTNRTDEQIKADQKKAQAEREAARKEHQRQVKEVADYFGIE